MEALVALVTPGVDAPELRAEVGSMLHQLWPESHRTDAITACDGIVLATSRTLSAAAVLGTPTVHQTGAACLVRRWDWPTLSGSRPSEAFITWNFGDSTLTVQRDPFGEASFWYAHDGCRFAVASHPAPLRSLKWVTDEPDPYGRLTLGLPVSRGDESPWRMVRRLKAGHRLHFARGSCRVERWWQLVEDSRWEARTDRQWFASAREALEQAVARRIPSAGLVGAQLSGGLDSTAVCLLASRALAASTRSLHTFSHVPAVQWHPPQPGDESPFIAAALTALPGATPHSCAGVADELSLPGGRQLRGHDREVRDAAEAAGVICLLSGWGGDEGISFNGDGFLAAELLRLRLPAVLRWSYEYGGRRVRGMLGVLFAKVVAPQLGRLRRHRRYWERDRPDWWDRVEGLPPPIRDEARRQRADRSDLRRAVSAHANQRRNLASPHIGDRSDADAEWSIPAGFCFRYPLLDPEVIQVALQAPERLFVLNGRTRTLMREAMRDLYPDLIYHRRGKFVSHPRRPEFRPLE